MADELVTLGSFMNPVEAAWAKGELEAAGIRAVLGDDNASTLFGGALDTIKLLVMQSDVDRALDILDRAASDSEEEGPPSEEIQSAEQLHGMHPHSPSQQAEAPSTAVAAKPQQVSVKLVEEARASDAASVENIETGDRDIRIELPGAAVAHTMKMAVVVILLGLVLLTGTSVVLSALLR